PVSCRESCRSTLDPGSAIDRGDLTSGFDPCNQPLIVEYARALTAPFLRLHDVGEFRVFSAGCLPERADATRFPQPQTGAGAGTSCETTCAASPCTSASSRGLCGAAAGATAGAGAASSSIRSLPVSTMPSTPS